MSFTITDQRQYEQSKEAVFTAALGAVDGLGGKVAQKDEAAGHLEVKFDKKILGKVLGDRTHLNVDIKQNDNQTIMALEIYPLDAVGRKLMFGARKGVSRTVADWFIAHIEHRLK